MRTTTLKWFCNTNLLFWLVVIQLLSANAAKAQNPKDNDLRAHQKKAIKQIDQGNFDQALSLLDTALILAQQGQESDTEAQVWLLRSDIHKKRGNYTEAMEALMPVLSIYQRMQSDSGEAIINEQMALVYKAQGRPGKALPLLLKSLAYKQSQFDSMGLARSYLRLGGVYASMDSLEKAAVYFEQSVAWYQNSSNPVNLAAALNNLANVYSFLGRTKSAEQSYLRSLKLKKVLGNHLGVAHSYNNLGNFYFNQGTNEKALGYFEQSAHLSDSLGTLDLLLTALENKAIVLESMDNLQASINLLWQCDSLRELVNENRFSQTVAKLQEEFEVEKKDFQIANLKNQNQLKALALKQERSKRLIWTLGAGLLVIALIFTFLSIRQHQRKNRQLGEKTAEIETKSKELAKTNEELRETAATKERLFTIIAHNLRGPLSALEGISEVMTHYLVRGQTDKLKRTVAEIDNTAFHTNSLIENLLNWVRVKTRDIPYQPQAIELQGVLEQSVELIKMQAKLKAIQLHLNIEEGIIIRADLNFIKTMMTNLLHNAIKFTPNGGSVLVNGQRHGQRVNIAVKDSGIGIDHNRLATLFEANASKSTPGTDGEHGTGLGLYVTQQFAKTEGGELRVQSRPGEGTTFTFSVALESDPSEEMTPH